MPKSRPPYPPEFRRRMIELVRWGRTPEQLAKEFEPSAQTIRNWAVQADRDAGQRQDGLTTEERDELRKLRREVKILREEKDIQKKPRPGSLGRPIRFRRRIRVRESASGHPPSPPAVPRAGRLRQRVLRLVCTRPASARATADAALLDRIRAFHT